MWEFHIQDSSYLARTGFGSNCTSNGWTCSLSSSLQGLRFWGLSFLESEKQSMQSRSRLYGFNYLKHFKIKMVHIYIHWFIHLPHIVCCIQNKSRSLDASHKVLWKEALRERKTQREDHIYRQLSIDAYINKLWENKQAYQRGFHSRCTGSRQVVGHPLCVDRTCMNRRLIEVFPQN